MIPLLDIDPEHSPVPSGLRRFLDGRGTEGVRACRFLEELGFSVSEARCASRLTPTGVPLEFCFTEESRGLRYTVECGVPQVNPEQRLPDICEFLLRRSAPLPPAELLDRVTVLQSRGSLTYGAWLGVRHGGDGDRFKIYVEIPTAAGPSAEDWMADVLGTSLRLPGPAARVKMIGLCAGSDRLEVYYAHIDTLRTGVAMALNRIGLSCTSDSLLSVIDGMTPFSPGAHLPTRDVGFSYAFALGKPEAVFTLYLVAQKLFGDDRGCSKWIGGRLPGHDELVRVLPQTSPGVTHHGMVGLTVAPGVTRPELSVGVASP